MAGLPDSDFEQQRRADTKEKAKVGGGQTPGRELRKLTRIYPAPEGNAPEMDMVSHDASPLPEVPSDNAHGPERFADETQTRQTANPFGFSGRRIGDLYAGLVKDASKANE